MKKLITICLTVMLLLDQVEAITLFHDNSNVQITENGQYANGFETLSPYSMSFGGRYYSSTSPWGGPCYYNGGSFYGGGVVTESSGFYQIAQLSPLGSDGCLLQVNLAIHTLASVDYYRVPPSWNITSGLYGYAENDVFVDLELQVNQPYSFYYCSTVDDPIYASLSVNGVEVVPGTKGLIVQADSGGIIDIGAYLMAQSESVNGLDGNDLTDSFEIQLTPVPEPASLGLLGLGGLALLRKRRA